jgi:hypothetical protein
MFAFFIAITVPDLFPRKHAGFEAACRVGSTLPGGGKRQPLEWQTKSRHAAFWDFSAIQDSHDTPFGGTHWLAALTLAAAQHLSLCQPD